MKKFNAKIKNLFTPVAVMLLVCALAIMSPLVSLTGVLRVQVMASASASGSFNITGLPARYVTIDTAVTPPTVTGGRAELWHAGRPVPVAGAKYDEVGKYEWRFYTSATEGAGDLFDVYTVTVTQADYQIVMPSVVPTVAPKSLTTLALPMPEKITKDGEEIALADPYKLEVNASMGSTTLEWGEDKDIKIEDNQVKINLTALGSQVGDLRVTYVLKNGENICVARVLSDIAIKNITDLSKVTFANNPAAPSVASLTYRDEIELARPVAGDAKYDNKTFAVEAWTKIIAVKFAEKQPDNWDKVSSIPVTDGKISNDTVKIDGLKVSVQKLGWYKFQFETTTLFGNKTENADDVDGKYWSDAVQIRQDATIPEFKWVAPYLDAAAELAKFDDIKGESDYARYLPMTTEPTDGAKAVTVNPVQGIDFPALLARDNGTKYEDLTYTVTITQVKDGSGNNLVNSTNRKTLTNSNYNPKQSLKLRFETNPGAEVTDNEVKLDKQNGLYQVTFQVTEKQPTYSNGDAGTGYNRSATQTCYFMVSDAFDMALDANAPTVESFQVSDVYLWEGRTFAFAVPTYTDVHTATTALAMDYYLVNASGQVAKLDASKMTNGRITVDLDNLVDEGNHKIDAFATDGVSIYAVARNFNALQNELRGEKFVFPQNDNELGSNRFPDDGAHKNGIRYKRASFTIHETIADSAAATSTITLDVAENGLKSGNKITINSLTTTWNKDNVDGSVSVAVYLLKDGKRSPVQVYNKNDEVVSTVLFNAQTNTIENWYFTPGVGGTYQMVVTTKENASSVRHHEVYTFNVAQNGEWNGGVTTAGVALMATAANDTLTLGATGTLPGWEGTAPDGTKLVARNRKLYNESEAVVGAYTITVKGVNDPNCVIGNKFIPNYTGTYKFAYNLNYGGSDHSFVYTVSVTANTEASGTIQMNQAYGDNPVLTRKESDGTNAPATAITLAEFILANKGGANNFVVGKDFLQTHLEEEENSDGQPTGRYLYPVIAIPMPNVISGAYTSDDVEITVQKSGSTEYLVSSKKKNIDGNKASKLGTVDGYYVFRPDGKFTSNQGDYILTAVDKNEVSAVYVVTYTLPDGKSAVYNITIGNPELGELVFNLGNGFLTYQNGNKTVNIDNDNTTPVIDKDSDGKRLVTIDMKKVTYDGANADFMALIQKGTDDARAAGVTDPDELAQWYIWEHALVSVSHNGSTFIYSSSWKDEEKDAENMTYTFDLSEGSGTYKINISLPNPYMNSNAAVQSFEFTIDTTATNKNVNLSTVWGIILIVLSVGLLAGVIFYFVKTARETKFLDTPKAPKKDKKAKDKEKDKTEGK